MSKNIVIVGGGISGLAVLHYVKQKYANQAEDVSIRLLEKDDCVGGTIRSVKQDGCLFEMGPNGFLDSKPRTLDFIKELHVDHALLRANSEAEIRYISVKDVLHEFPTSPRTFLSFKLLNLFQKLRVVAEVFIKRGGSETETVYDFGKRRLGERFSQIFLDPMVSGIYGGDASQTVLKEVFPRIYELEEQYGSLFKAMIRLKKEKKKAQNNGESRGAMGAPKGVLTSFEGGMSQLIDKIGCCYKENISLNQEVKYVRRNGDGFIVGLEGGGEQEADELFMCSPAYAVAPMVQEIDEDLVALLEQVRYAPMVVVGLIYPIAFCKRRPKGYGYLIPSLDKKQVLGVLFDGNIFPQRCREDQVLFRVMIGGARYPEIFYRTEEELVMLAKREVSQFTGEVAPQKVFFKGWRQAIPQYDWRYCKLSEYLNRHASKYKNMHFVANYLKGVSLNDCIENAYKAVCEE